MELIRMTALPDSIFRDFKETLISEGFYKRRYGYYAVLFIFISIAYALSVYVLLNTDSVFIHLINAVCMGIITVQAGIFGHDLSHNQVFTSKKLNKLSAVLVWGVFAGLSESKWYFNHNAHHKEVNHSEHDPDLQMPFIFGDEQIEYKKDAFRSLRKYQHIIFFLVLPLVFPIYILRSIVHNVSFLNKIAILELLLMTVHYVLFFFVLFSNLSLLTAIAFLCIMSFVAGTYMGLVFAPNHKGMPMVAKDAKVEWWHQIVCTRNLYPNAFLFHTMGGLNYQIEHHLFPSMPRINYPKVAPKVKAFCIQNNLSYHETTWIDSLREIYASLRSKTDI